MKLSRKIHTKSDFTKKSRNSRFSWRKKQLFWPFSMDVVLVFYREDCRLCCSLAPDLGAHSFITGNYSSWVLFNLGLSVGVYLVQEVDRDIKGGAKFSSFLQGSPTKRRSFDVRPAKYEFSFGGDLFKNAAPETFDERNVNKTLSVVILKTKNCVKSTEKWCLYTVLTVVVELNMDIFTITITRKLEEKSFKRGFLTWTC